MPILSTRPAVTFLAAGITVCWPAPNYTVCVDVRNPKRGQFVPFLKHASVTVYDVPSVSTRGKTLGSVCYSDGFVDSSLTVSDSGLYLFAVV